MAYVSQQIRDLRKQGQLREALNLAVSAHRENPNDRYVTSELTWVLYYCLKRYGDPDSDFYGNVSAYLKALKAIENHGFNALENQLFFDNLSKNIGSVAWDLVHKKNGNSLLDLFRVVCELSEQCDGLRNVVLFRAFLKGFKDNTRALLDAITWYDLGSFTYEDYEDEIYQEKKIPGIAESAVNAYLDACIKRDYNGYFIATREEQEAAAHQVRPFLTRNVCKHWKWLPYKLGKLLIEMGLQPEARDVLGPFLLSNPKDFYVWATYADACLPDQPDMYRSCIFMALLLSSDPKFALGYHEIALNIFIKDGNLPAAKAEAILISKCRSEQGWKASQLVTSIECEPWYDKTEARDDNETLYKDLSRDADSVLAEFVPSIDFYLEWTDQKKGLLGVVTLPKAPFGVSYGRLETAQRTLIKDKVRAASLEPSELYTGSLSIKSRSIYGAVAKSSNQRLRAVFIHPFEGVFEPVGTHGFVHQLRESIYIPATQVEKHEVMPYSFVSGEKVAVFKKNKDKEGGEWRWEARIDQVMPPDMSEYETVVEGNVRLTRKGDAFVDSDFFIPGPLATECDLRNGDWVKARAFKAWNKKKESWGWRINEILDRRDSSPDNSSSNNED